ncbi:hypothetical protein V6N13_065389 [Hibiscus sabdariffa]
MRATGIEALSTEGTQPLRFFTPQRFVPTQQRVRNATNIEGTQSFFMLLRFVLTQQVEFITSPRRTEVEIEDDSNEEERPL